MEQRTSTLGFTTIALVGLAAILRGPTTLVSPAAPAKAAADTATAPVPAQKPASGKSVAAPGYSHGQELLLRFFGDTALPAKLANQRTPKPATKPANSPAAPPVKPSAKRLSGARQSGRSAAKLDTLYDFDALVATLPDPVDSHLDWAFDTGLEAIRRAFEVSQYIIEGFWLPPRDTVEVPAGGVRMPRREREPGVVLFRSTEGRGLRLLYLVPEVPTSGIYKEALFAALAERARLRTITTLPLIDTARVLRVIGPTFSGSALSLRLALRRAPAPRLPVRIVSGSATSLSNLAALTGDGLTFGATVNPHESLEAVLRIVLRRLAIPDSQVAILQESSTPYGRSLFVGAPLRGAGGAFLTIPFPMSISSLRTEYQRLPVTPTQAPALPGARTQPELPLDLVDPVRARTDLPVTSRLTAPALDLVLDDVARTVRTHHIRMIGLLATDVRDKLFLGKELKQRVRDVRFFTFESNVLYLRPDHSRWLRGMLVFSTYPLLLEQHDDGGRPHLAFSDEGAEGTFNATLIQLGNQGEMRDYGDTGATGDLRPPVWITTVGNAAFLPVATDAHHRMPGYVLPSDSAKAVLLRGRPGGAPTWLSASDTTAIRAARVVDFLPFASIMFVGVALIVLARWSWRDYTRPWSPATPSSFEGTMRKQWETVRADSLRLHGRLYTALRLTAAISVGIAATAPFALLAHRKATLGPGLWVALMVAALVGVAALLVSWGRLVSAFLRALPAGTRFLTGRWPSQWRRASWGVEVFGRLLVAFAGLGYLALSIWFGWSVSHLSAAVAELYRPRIAAIDSLVSPLLPLILAGAGFGVWASWHLRRVVLLRELTIFESACTEALTDPVPEQPSTADVFRADLRRAAHAVDRVQSRLFMLLPSAGAYVLLAALVVLGIWVWPQFGMSIEALTLPSINFRLIGPLDAFDMLLRLSILASFAATAWATFRLVVVWRALRRCLAALRDMPLLPAFERLPERTLGTALLGTGHRSAAADPGVTVDTAWQQLVNLYGAKKGDIEQQLPGSAIGQALEMLMRLPPVRPWRLDREAQAVEVDRFRALHAVLCELWAREPDKADVDAAAGTLRDAPVSFAAGNTTAGRISRSFAGATGLWRRAAEEYAAGVVTDYLQWAMRQLYVLAMFLLLSLLLVTALLSSYPFQPQSMLKLVFLCLLLTTVGAMMLVLLQANRDEVLSRINQTEPGRITWSLGFATSVFTFGIVPLLTLLSSEFPALQDVVFSWAQPLVKLVVKQ